MSPVTTYTIADMICYPWTVNWKAQGQDIDEFPHFKRWFEEIGERPAVKRGMAAGADLSVDVSKLPPDGTGSHPPDHVQPARDPGAGGISAGRYLPEAASTSTAPDRASTGAIACDAAATGRAGRPSVGWPADGTERSFPRPPRTGSRPSRRAARSGS